MNIFKKNPITLILNNIINEINNHNIKSLNGPYSCRKTDDAYKCKVNGDILEIDMLYGFIGGGYVLYFNGTKITTNQRKLKKIHKLLSLYKLIK